MNISLITRALPAHSIGGMELNVFLLGRALSKIGHRVTIFTTAHPKNPDVVVRDHVDGVDLAYIPGGAMGWYSDEWGRNLAKVFIDGHLKNRFHVVHSHNSSGLGLFRADVFTKLNVPHIITWHGTHLEWLRSANRAVLATGGERQLREAARIPAILKRWLKDDLWLTRAADRLIALDPVTARRIQWQYLVRSGKIEIIETGVNTEIFGNGNRRAAKNSLGLAGVYPLLLGVGRLVFEKGFDTAVNAMPSMLKYFPDAKLLIVGEGPEKPLLMKRVSELGLGLSNSVIFRGGVAQEELPVFYQAADVFINPIRQPGSYNTTILEAMCCGCPVVTSHEVKTSGVIEHEHTCLLIPPASEELLVESVYRLLNNKTLNQRLVCKANEIVAGYLCWDQIALRTSNLYQAVIMDRISPPCGAPDLLIKNR
jgi:glycosyltransferase involved in cell wall biosynthesis